MKKILLLLVAFTLCISMCSCDSILKKAKSAVTGEEESEMPEDYIATLENDEYKYELYDSYVKVIAYIAPEGSDTAVTVPSEIDGKPVTTIGSLCFYDTENPVTAVTIPSSVTEIEENAFYYVEGLTEITIPDSVQKIGSRAFAWCNNLESVNFGNGLTEISDFCFNHCVSLKTVSIPSKVNRIGSRAFSYCDGLNEIVIPETVAELGDRVFDTCSNLEYVLFDNESITLGNAVFENCEKNVVISAENSTVKAYCEENGLRWSTSKDVEAIVPGELSDADNSENVSSN